MCGRFQLSKEAFAALQPIAYIPRYIQDELNFGMRYPSQLALILKNEDGVLCGDLAAFGTETTIAGKKKRLINARAETAMEKYPFKQSVAKRRCIVPASCFYEWDAAKQMISFFEKDWPVLFMAAIYDDNGFVILTTQANDSMEPFHHRMPVLLKSDELEEWVFDPQASWRILHSIPERVEHAFVH